MSSGLTQLGNSSEKKREL